LSDYAPTVEAMGRIFGKLAANPSPPEMVADVIWEAANDTGKRLRYRAGLDANRLLDDRKARDDERFIADMKDLMGS
jgi:hypothetical protein